MKITIITVVYNNAATIERTIKSVINQSHKDVEYIIIDGGSTDGTLEVIKKYGKNISKWISEKDSGIYNAMNKGIALATGDVVAFMNSDDWYVEDAIEKVNNQFCVGEYDIVFGNIVFCGENTRKNSEVNMDSVDNMYLKMSVCHPATFARKELFSKYGEFDEKYRVAADYEWILRVLNHKVKYAVLDDILAEFSCEGISSREVEMTIEESRKIALKHAKTKEQIQEISYYYAMRIFPYRTDLSKERLRKVLKSKGKNIYIFGSGEYGKMYLELLRRYGFNVVGFIDNNREKWWKEINGVMVRGIEDVVCGDAVVLIAIKNHEESIKVQLQDIGFQDKSIITYLELIDKYYMTDE